MLKEEEQKHYNQMDEEDLFKDLTFIGDSKNDKHKAEQKE